MNTVWGRWVYLPVGDPRRVDTAVEDSPNSPAVAIDMGDGELYDFSVLRLNVEGGAWHWLQHLHDKEWWQRGDADDYLAMVADLVEAGVLAPTVYEA